jgi:hypothetical protein
VDPVTHTVVTRLCVGRSPGILLAGVVADAPFYLTYPVWLLRRRGVITSLTTNEWPAPPRWMVILHQLFHSLPIVYAGAGLYRVLYGRWPSSAVKAWTLHILIDIPTHTREPWGPRFLWPISSIAVDGVSWAEWFVGTIAAVMRAMSKRL